MNKASKFATTVSAGSFLVTSVIAETPERTEYAKNTALIQTVIDEGCPDNGYKKSEQVSIVLGCFSALLSASAALKNGFATVVNRELSGMEQEKREDAEEYLAQLEECGDKITIAENQPKATLKTHGAFVYDAVKFCTDTIHNGKGSVGITFEAAANLYVRTHAAAILDPIPMTVEEYRNTLGWNP